MEPQKENLSLLELLPDPGFCVQNGKIIKINAAAAALSLTEGSEVFPLLLTGAQEYGNVPFDQMHLTVRLGSLGRSATVTRLDGMDVFVLDPQNSNKELIALALAAKELREPLTGAMLSAAALSELSELSPEAKQYTTRLNRGLYRMLRVIGNMSDAAGDPLTHQEMTDIAALFQEVFEKAAALTQKNDIHLSCEGFSEPVYTLANRQSLERAALNLLSNAIKFSPKGGAVSVSLTRREQLLYFSVQDQGDGVPENIRSTIFTRYLRQPNFEDSRFGLGLGMVLVKAAAAEHSGAILVDRPKGAGTRVTMTIALRKGSAPLRSNMFQVDYTGEQDHALIELSPVLPVEAFENL